MKTKLYQISGESYLMMSYAVITKNDNVIIIDGGQASDMTALREVIGDRHVSAWILTHPHSDHIGGFVSECRRNGLSDFNPDKVYCHFHAPTIMTDPAFEVYKGDWGEILSAFYEVMPLIEEKIVIPEADDIFEIDEVKIEIIQTVKEAERADIINNSSMVFRLSTPDKSVMFLGDIGPEAGDRLYYYKRDRLPSDMVQMAHHGVFGASLEVYFAISPKTCLWTCREPVYSGEKIGAHVYANMKYEHLRRFNATVTREWMERLGVKEHITLEEGTKEIIL